MGRDRAGEIAGHRTTYLHPFYNFDEMQVGRPDRAPDRVRLIRLRGDASVRGPSVSGSGVVLTQTPKPSLVLTTCHPRYSASQRLIVIADRVG